MTDLLSPTELEEALQVLPGWESTGQALRRSIEFASFTDAFAFMGKVAVVAEELQHHPDWRNIYNRLDIVLSTHDSGGVTSKDLALAGRINALLEG